MRPDVDRYFIDMARLVSSRSTCVRRSVGCVLVNARHHVLATGYNGTPAGAKHCNEPEVLRHVTPQEWTGARVVFPHACAGAGVTQSGTALDSCDAVHAEQNAVLQCIDANAIATAYVTAFPCTSCAKLLLNTSCREIVYVDAYGDTGGIDLWVRAGRLAVRFEGEPPMIQRDLVRLFHDALDEWRVVVACVCLNLASARVARGIVMRVLNRWPRPELMGAAGDDLTQVLQPLGLAGRRSEYLRRIGRSWGKIALEDLPGVGPYAVDSVKVFCRGELPDKIGDRKVSAWVAWKRRDMAKTVD